MCLYSVPGPVGSVSSIMDTTWAVISWSVPSYIPQAYPIIRYEIGYHVLNNCSMADVDDINIQILSRSNVSSDSTFINTTGLRDNTCFIFGVRAYTDNGYGEWTVIANETLHLPPQPSPTVASSLINEASGIIIVYFHNFISFKTVSLTTMEFSVITIGSILGSVVLTILLLVIIIVIIILMRYQFCIAIYYHHNYRIKRSHSKGGKYQVDISLSQLQGKCILCSEINI